MADIMKTFIKHMDGVNKAAVADAAARAMAEHCDARITEVANLLRVAMDDYDSNNGRVNEKKMPKHWTVKARKLLRANQ